MKKGTGMIVKPVQRMLGEIYIVGEEEDAELKQDCCMGCKIPEHPQGSQTFNVILSAQ